MSGAAHRIGEQPTGPHPIKARRVAFDWTTTPLHWIPDEPTATHVINVLHLLLPAGERWFVKVLKEGLPLVTDPELRGDVKGFMGQEATHSVQHSYVLDHLAEQRLPTEAYTRHVDFLFEKLLGETPPFGVPVTPREWLRFRLAVVAAIEQFTAVLGDWVLRAEGLDRAGADEIMLDLLRWHGAEEVEHRSVAFDMYQHCGERVCPLRAAHRGDGRGRARAGVAVDVGRLVPHTQRPRTGWPAALLAPRAQPRGGQGSAAHVERARHGHTPLLPAVVPSLAGGLAAQGGRVPCGFTCRPRRGGRGRPSRDVVGSRD